MLSWPTRRHVHEELRLLWTSQQARRCGLLADMHATLKATNAKLQVFRAYPPDAREEGRNDVTDILEPPSRVAVVSPNWSNQRRIDRVGELMINHGNSRIASNCKVHGGSGRLIESQQRQPRALESARRSAQAGRSARRP